MPRHRKLRKIVAPPGFRGYRPYGHHGRVTQFVELLYEEYEAMKLADYDGMNHEEASKLMGISRPTFARIYDSARKKIAQALVETKEIRTAYGNADLDESWFICIDCNARYTVPPTVRNGACPMCKSMNTKSVNTINDI